MDRTNIQLSEETVAIEAQAAERALFPEEGQTRDRVSRPLKIAGAGFTTAITIGAYKAGINLESLNNVFDASFVPSTPVAPEIVDGFVTVNETLRGVAPLVLLGGLGVRGRQIIRSRRNDYEATVESLAGSDYSGTDDLLSELPENGDHKKANKIRKVTAGLGVAVLTALFAGGSSGVEHEVSNGPLRPVEQVFDSFSATEDDRHILVQTSTATFMSDSYVGAEDMSIVVDKGTEDGVLVVPFGKSLPDIDGRSGLALSIPDKVFDQRLGVESSDEGDCQQIEIILDEANTTPVGESVEINGVDAKVAGKMSNTAQMNRDIAIMRQSDMNDCIQKTSDPKYFGAIISGGNASELRAEINLHSDINGEVVTEEHFEDSNRDFWRKNGTPILLELIAYGGAIGAFAISSERRASLQRHIREIGTLNASGVSMRDIRKVETRRALKDTGIATLIAAPLMPVMAAAFNAAEVGLKVGVGLREVAVGYTVALAAKIMGSRRAVKRFAKNLNPAEAVKG